MRYQGFTPEERQNEILDKISKYGISTITESEKEFLDSFSKGTEQLVHKKLNFLENERVFEDDSGLFKFELERIDNFINEQNIIGTIYVPDIVFEDGSYIDGRLQGKIINFGGGKTALDFQIEFMSESGKTFEYDIFEFCSGIEYELDTFIDYVVSELEKHDY